MAGGFGLVQGKPEVDGSTSVDDAAVGTTDAGTTDGGVPTTSGGAATGDAGTDAVDGAMDGDEGTSDVTEEPHTGASEPDPDTAVAEPAPAEPAAATGGMTAVAEKPRRTRSGAGMAAATRLLVVASVLVFACGGVWLVARAATPLAGPTTTEIPAMQVEAASVEPGSVAPVTDTIGGGPAAGPGAVPPVEQPREQERPAADPLTEWANKAAPVVGVPARALVAYGHAELAMRADKPNCRISWATLAGLGRIESNHGQYGGATLREDGRPSIPIIGVPLDGSPGVRAIGDTDGGRFDGDVNGDRAVGPMQFIPGTWVKYNSDGSGDGLGDPQQIDDAALAAGRYLCVGGRDMASAQGWWSGVMSYNNSVEYGQKVFGLADGYARAASKVKVG